LLAQLRQADRQPPPEEIKEHRQIIQETRQEIKPDYQQLHQRNQELEAEVLRLKEIVEQAPTTTKPELFSLRDRMKENFDYRVGESRHHLAAILKLLLEFWIGSLRNCKNLHQFLHLYLHRSKTCRTTYDPAIKAESFLKGFSI